jgi:hypothetical protein
MSSKRADPDPVPEGEGKASWLRDAFDFFRRVLDTLQKHPVLSLAWGVEVLLFVILVFMVLSGAIRGERAFQLVLFVVVAVVATLAITLSRTPTEEAPIAALPRLLQAQARKCLDLLTQIDESNQRVLLRGASGADAWVRALTEDYNVVCRRCAELRHERSSSDPHLGVVCADPDLRTVCDKKWLLGEALEDYRKRVAEAPPTTALDHEALEALIRRSVVQPALTARALESAVRGAISEAKRVAESG